MPELPEVEHGRRIAERCSVGRRIVRVRCPRDEIVFEGVTPARMRRALSGARVLGTGRRGKHLWLELDRRPWPLFHFGMTGAFRVRDETPLHLASDAATPALEWPPPFAKIHLFLDDGGELVMTNKRRLGRIRLRQDPLSEPPISRLGFDPLLDLPPPRALAAALGRRTGTIKGLLLDQSFAAGVGNWIADEVLFQAGIDPRRRASSLVADEIRRLHRKIRSVIRKAVSVDADKSRFPRTWLFHHRWGKNADARTARGEPIEHLTVAGRTTAWVPTRQR